MRRVGGHAVTEKLLLAFHSPPKAQLLLSRVEEGAQELVPSAVSSERSHPRDIRSEVKQGKVMSGVRTALIPISSPGKNPCAAPVRASEAKD